MVSHSSSASHSSLNCSHTSSSSPSSPPSSPNSSQDSLSSFSASSTLALVPFLWEETPGVLKKEMQSSEGGYNLGEGKRTGSFSHDVHACTHRDDSYVQSSRRISRPFTASRSKARSESVPRLCPPPCLSRPSMHAYVQSEDDVDVLQHPHYCGGRSKVMSAFSFHRRRHHQRIPSLEDDPFWMAMVACTNDEGQERRMRFEGDRGKVCRAMRRRDSWFAKTVQGRAVRLEQCMPRRTLASCADSTLSSSNCRRLKSEAISGNGGIKSTSPLKFKGAGDGYDRRDCAGKGVHSADLASKAFRALNIAKSELHGRSKVLLQRQSFPVDISCSARHSKKSSFASKRKLPDFFGCKSNRPLIRPS